MSIRIFKYLSPTDTIPACIQGLPVPWLGSVVADGIFLDRYSGAELFIKTRRS